MEKETYAVVALALQQLTELELSAQYNASAAGFNPKPVMGYDKISHLFTENDGREMHSSVAECFRLYAHHVFSGQIEHPLVTAATDTPTEPT